MRKIKLPLFLVMALCVSGLSHANVHYFSFRTTAELFDTANPATRAELVDYICGDQSLEMFGPTQDFYLSMTSSNANKDSFNSLAACLVASSMTRIYKMVRDHYGFNLDSSSDAIKESLSHLSRQKIKKDIETISGLLKRYSKGTSLKHGFIIGLSEKRGLIRVGRITRTDATKNILGEFGNFSGSGREEVSTKLQSDYKKLVTSLFIQFFKEASKDSAFEQYKRSFNVDEVREVILELNRPSYSFEDQRPYHGGASFHLGLESKIKSLKGNTWAVGYIELDRSERAFPSKKVNRKDEWTFYKVGGERSDSSYPMLQSDFISNSLNPFSLSFVKELTAGLGGRTARSSGHGLLILRRKGKEYITLEGRPCSQIDGDRDKLRCQLPLVATKDFPSEFIEKVSEYNKKVLDELKRRKK